MRPVLLLLAVPLVVAACGGSSKGAATTSTAGGQAKDFVTAANAVCMASDKRIFKIGRLTRDPAGWKRTADASKVAVREMKALTPPAEKRAAFDRMLKYANALTLAIQEAHQSLVKKDIDTAAAAQLAAGQLSDKVKEAAREAGLTFCQQQLANWPA